MNIIAGPLGAGKTTTLNSLLERRPSGKRWAVLVNEYGLVGLDAALMEPGTDRGPSGGVEVREVAGGCICCSAGVMFEVALMRLIEEHPDRLLIEPTGLAALSGILDTLERRGIREAVDVRSVVCLLDPSRVADDLRRAEVWDPVHAPDLLLASRSDLATEAQLEAFDAWAGRLFPPKAHVGRLERGRLAPALLDLVSHRGVTGPRGGHRHGTDHDHQHDHDHEVPEGDAAGDATAMALPSPARPIVRRSHRSEVTSTLGWVCWAGLVFDAEQGSRWLSALAALPGARRAKAVMHTNEGWWSFNVAAGAEDLRPSGYRRDSRVEVVIEGADFPDADALEQALRACVVSTYPTVAC